MRDSSNLSILATACFWIGGIPQKVFPIFDNVFYVYVIDEGIVKNILFK